MHILYYDNPKSQTPRNRYVLVITCLTVCATHLELVKTMKTEDFIAALRSHIALNGMFSVCWSDNALHFKQVSVTSKGFLKGIDLKRVEEHITTSSPGATGSGSNQSTLHRQDVLNESLAQLKQYLTKDQERSIIVDTKSLQDKMQILLYEVSNMLNNRPLTAVFSQKGEISNVLNITPNFLIRGQSTYCLSDNFRFQPHTRPADKLRVDYKDEILHHIRGYALIENNYLKLTQPLHHCLIHYLSEAAKVDKLEARLHLDHITRQLIKGSGFHKDTNSTGDDTKVTAKETSQIQTMKMVLLIMGYKIHAHIYGLRKRFNEE